MKRFTRHLAATVLLCLVLLAAPQAFANSLIAGFLAQCTAVGAGSCTEQTGAAYARQPIGFSNPAINGASVQSIPYTYAQGVTGSIAGHAIYDALTAGNLIAVIPYATALTIPSIGDRGDVGSLRFTLSPAIGYPLDGFNAVFQSGSTLGTTPDGSTVTAGIALTVQHGEGFPNLGSADSTTRQVVELTGFSYPVPIGVSALNFKGAGTLATGATALPLPATDGFLFRLACSVTITALTITVPGATVVGTLPTTCGPAASHELQYYAGDLTWHVLF